MVDPFEITRSGIERDELLLDDGTILPYDVLVVATGSRLQPEETEGLTGPGWNERAFTFYTPEGAAALATALERFDGGRVVVNLVDMPIKCPVAPLEFAFLAEWYFRERGIRDRVDLVFSTPLDAAFTKPVASEHLAGLLDEKAIELVTEFNAGEVDSDRGKLISYDGRELDFDLLVTVPLHGGAAFIERSPGLGDALGFVPTDKSTLQSKARPNVFALGDAADLPTSKAGSVTHFEAEVLAENVARFLAGDELEPGYDGHSNCFIETGFHKALLIDFNYETEPLPGHYPTALGLPLLRESGSTTSGSSCSSGSTGMCCSRARPAGHRARDADRRQETRPVTLERKEDEMTMTLIADAPVDVDAEGFMTDPDQWNEHDRRGDRPRRTGSPS